LTERFFVEKRAAAVLKHGILKRYLHIFCSKTGYTSEAHRVVYLDGYAGPGIYSDGQPGSPALAGATAEALADVRDLLGVYVEENPTTASTLEKTLAKTKHSCHVLRGDFREQLPNALSLVRQHDPLFAFVDPFGLPAPFEQLLEIMRHADFHDGFRYGPPTELLLNFSHAGLRRTAGHLTAQSTADSYRKARKTMLARLDLTFGGDWWRAIWDSEAGDRIDQIATEYMTRLGNSTLAQGWYRVPVKRALHGPVMYDLMFFTHHPEQGVWHFNESVSLALEEYHEFCTRSELDLNPKTEREVRWIEAVQANIRQILDGASSFVVWDRFTDVYGEYLGYARQTHLRRAIKRLHRDGLIDHDGKGDLEHAVIRRGEE
jgi:three-Cys-motif partner protein